MLLMALVRGMSRKKAPDQTSVSNAMQNFHNILLFAAVTCRLKKFEMKNEKINTFHKSKLTETNIQTHSNLSVTHHSCEYIGYTVGKRKYRIITVHILKRCIHSLVVQDHQSSSSSSSSSSLSRRACCLIAAAKSLAMVVSSCFFSSSAFASPAVMSLTPALPLDCAT